MSRRSERQDAWSGSSGGNYSFRIGSRQPTSNSVLGRRIDCLENTIKQIAAHTGLFQRQVQQGDKSRAVDWNSCSRENEDEVGEEQQVQDGGRGVSDGAHEEPQTHNSGLERAEEANSDVTEECMQDGRVSI